MFVDLFRSIHAFSSHAHFTAGQAFRLRYFVEEPNLRDPLFNLERYIQKYK